MRQRRRGLVRQRLQRVDAQIERRALGERGALGRALVAEHRGEMGVEPFRIVAGDMSRRAFEAGGLEPGALVVGQRRRGEAAAVAQAGNGVSALLPAGEPQRAEQHGAGIVPAHHIARRGTPAQRVMHQAGNGGAVAGAGEAVVAAPVLQHVGGRPARGVNGGEDFNGSGKPRGRRHGWYAITG